MLKDALKEIAEDIMNVVDKNLYLLAGERDFSPAISFLLNPNDFSKVMLLPDIKMEGDIEYLFGISSINSSTFRKAKLFYKNYTIVFVTVPYYKGPPTVNYGIVGENK